MTVWVSPEDSDLIGLECSQGTGICSNLPSGCNVHPGLGPTVEDQHASLFKKPGALTIPGAWASVGCRRALYRYTRGRMKITLSSLVAHLIGEETWKTSPNSHARSSVFANVPIALGTQVLTGGISIKAGEDHLG